MTAIKIEEQLRTILDFSGVKSSKSGIKRALQDCQIANIVEDENTGELTIYLNMIKIGMYHILLQLPPDSPASCNKLKDYKDFEIWIYDSDDPRTSRINLKKDRRFKDQYWVQHNFFGKLRTKHLVDAIAYCQRLDRLRAFL